MPAKGHHHTAESKQKISAAMKGRVSPTKGRHHTAESKQKISAAMKGRKGPIGNTPWNKGKHMSESQKKGCFKLGNQIGRGRQASAEFRQKLRDVQHNRWYKHRMIEKNLRNSIVIAYDAIFAKEETAELSIFIDLETGDMIYCSHVTPSHIAAEFLDLANDREYIHIHNHTTDVTFSDTDLRIFAEHINVRQMHLCLANKTIVVLRKKLRHKYLPTEEVITRWGTAAEFACVHCCTFDLAESHKIGAEAGLQAVLEYWGKYVHIRKFKTVSDLCANMCLGR